MPNPKVVKSLQEICLDALAEIVENAKCCTMLPVEENVKPERCSPFDVLRMSLNQFQYSFSLNHYLVIVSFNVLIVFSFLDDNGHHGYH